jgi:hypothetical protein
MIANHYLLYHKYIRIISDLSKKTGLPLRQALDVFYTSSTFYDISHGISDMHCRSDGYLVDELIQEIEQTSEVRAFSK